MREQARAISISQVRPKEDEKRQGNGGEEDRHQPEIADCGTFVSEPQGVNGKQWQRHHGGHGQTRRHGTLSAGAIGVRIEIVLRGSVESGTFLVSNYARESEPKKRGNQGKIIQATRVVTAELESDVDV